MPSFFKNLSPVYVVGTVAVVSVAVVTIVFIATGSRPKTLSVPVSRTDITESIDATGTVKPAETVDLAFQRSGTIASINVDVGDRVGAGTVLASLSSADLQAQLKQAQANLAVAQANLTKLQVGTRPETLTTDHDALIQAMGSAYIAVQDAVHTQVDQFLNQPHTASPALTFSVSNSNLQNKALTERVAIENMFSTWQSQMPSANTSDADLLMMALAVEQNLTTVETFLDDIAQLLNAALSSSNPTQATIDGYKTAVGIGRTEVSSALSKVVAARGALSLDTAGSRTEDVLAQEGTVAAQNAAVDAIEAQIGQTVIVAPISGTISRQDGHRGQAIGLNTPFISLISSAQFQIEAFVSEADIGKIKVGQDAEVHLDAYPNETFTAKVISVDPAATIQNGIPSYKVTVQFTQTNAKIKAGLTANVSIVGASVKNVLTVPQSAIITKNGHTYILKVAPDGTQNLQEVTLGISGGSNVEVRSGLTEGDQIAAFGTAAQ